MAGTSLSILDKILKEDYLAPIQTQFNNSSILMQRLTKNEEDVGGKKAIVPLHTGRNSGVGARAENGTLPTAGYQQYDQAVYNCAYNYARIQIPGPAIKASRTDKYAFVRAIDSEIEGAAKDIKEEVNVQLQGDGTGVIGQVNGDPGTGTTLTMDNPSALYIQKGMLLDVVDPASVTAGDGRTSCTGLTVSARATALTATMSAALDASIADNDLIVRAGNYRLAMMGLRGIVNNQNAGYGLVTTAMSVGGISRAVAGNEFWKAGYLDNSGTARKLTLDLMQQGFDTAEGEGGEISLVMTDYTQRRKYLALVKADGRFVNSLKLDGGFTALEYNEKPLVVDRHCYPGRILFLDESSLAIYRMSDIEWMEEDGAVLSRVSGKDAYEAILYYYATLGCKAPSHNCALVDLTTS
jgi:hypothetical protein